MNCLGMVHHDAKLVAGCGDGRLYMFNWGEFGLHSADFPGHPDAINHLASLVEIQFQMPLVDILQATGRQMSVNLLMLFCSCFLGHA